MRAWFLFVAGMVMSPMLHGQNTLVVTIEGVSDKEGSIMVGLFRDQKTFLKRPAYGKVVSVEGAATRVIFENLEPGDYGVSVIHDKNRNGKLDTNILGIPKEGFGFGNNAIGVFGPPSFDKARISVTTGQLEHKIRIKYF